MANFNDAVKKVLDAEGGFVNHPNDPGGATNFGITLNTYQTWMRKKTGNPNYVVTIDEMIRMPIGNAITIYKEEYWDAVRGDEIKMFSSALVIFDQAVNAGVVTSIKRAQRVLGLKDDGIMGPETLRVLNATDDKVFVKSFLDASKIYYNAIIERNPKLEVFRSGWYNRLANLEKFISPFYGIINSTAGKVGISIASVAILGGMFFFIRKYLMARKGASTAGMIPKAA